MKTSVLVNHLFVFFCHRDLPEVGFTPATYPDWIFLATLRRLRLTLLVILRKVTADLSQRMYSYLLGLGLGLGLTVV